MAAQPATLAYTVQRPADSDRETWMAPERTGQLLRWAEVYYPDAARPASAAVILYRGNVATGGKHAIPLQAAQFMARCHVEWSHPDDAGSFVVVASL